MPSPVTLRIDAAETDTAEALALLGRIRAFADEMRAAGLDVTVDGSLHVVVRVPEPKDEPEAAETEAANA